MTLNPHRWKEEFESEPRTEARGQYGMEFSRKVDGREVVVDGFEVYSPGRWINDGDGNNNAECIEQDWNLLVVATETIPEGIPFSHRILCFPLTHPGRI